MNDDKRIIDIICDSLLPLAFLFLVVICIICCFTLPVHAASDQDYFPMLQNNNGHFTEEWKTMFETQLDSENYNILVMYRYYQQSLGRYHFYFVRYPKDADGAIYGEVNNDLIHWSLYKYNHPSTNAGSAYIQNDTLVLTYGGNAYEIFLNLESSNYNTDIDYISNFQLYSSNNIDTRRIVLMYSSGDEVIGDDDTVPEGTEKPDFENYFPEDTTPPTFDNSSVEAALGSIFDYLQYETNKISGTLSGIGKYLSDSLMWGLQMVINNIRSKIQEMITAIGDKINEVKVGIGSIIDNIEDFVDYIKEPIDKQAIDEALEGTTLYSVSTIGSSIKNIFSDYFDSIPQIDTLVFNIPYTILTKSGFITVDFSWYSGIRSSVLPWIVGFLYAGFALALFRSIPSIIHGVSGVLQKGG